MTDNPILAALQKLDVANDKHWNSDGLPAVEAVRELSGIKDLKRTDVTALAPELTREAARLAAAPPPSLDKGTMDQGATDGTTLPPVEEQPDEIQVMRKRLAELSEKLIPAKQAEINRASKELVALTEEQDELIKALDPGTNSHAKNQSEIMHFLASQQRQRAARVAAQQRALGALDPRTLDARSPLDRAFARQNTRGTVPPTRREQ